MSEFVIKSPPMTSAIGEASTKKYKKIIGKNGKIYLVALQENSADNIYVEGGPNSDGFGGRTLTFTLEDGSTLSLKGPWRTNSHDVFAQTGVDIRDKHYTFGVIAKSHENCSKSWMGKLVDIVYEDDGWTLGPFDRIEQFAQKMANEQNCRFYFYSESMSGSHTSHVDPISTIS